jgi:hypothetical protein
MMGRTYRRARLPLLAALVSAALAGCNHGDADRSSTSGDSVPGEAASSRSDSGAALAMVGDPPPAADAHFTDAAGQDWSKAEGYLKLLAFENTGDSESVDDIELCEGCAHSTFVRIQPVRGVEHLGPKNVFDARRIVARVTIDALDEKTDTRRLRALGLPRDNKSRTSYLLVRKDGRAVFMYERGGKIAFSPYTWTFDASSDGTMMNRPVAHWRELHKDSLKSDAEVAAPDTVVVTHTSSIWLSCAEGCCNAQTTL